MYKDYVSFETAQILKEKGIDGGWFDRYYNLNYPYCPCVVGVEGCIPAPTLQKSMRWLREVHNVIVNVYYDEYGSSVSNPWVAEYFRNVEKDFVLIGFYPSYEDAAEAVINYGSKYLI